MKATSHLCSVIVAVAIVSTSSAFAQNSAPSTAAGPATSGSTSTQPSAATAQAESEYQNAQAACNYQSLNVRQDCLDAAKAKYDRAIRGAESSITGPKNGANAGSASDQARGGTSAGTSGGGQSGSPSGGQTGSPSGDTGGGTPK